MRQTTYNNRMNFAPSTTDRILSEAQERAQQILMLGTQEAAALTARLVVIGRTKVEEQFGQLTRKQLSLHRISRSEAINHYRMLKIRAKYDRCELIFQEVEQRLAGIASSQEQSYRLFLVETITDGLVRMFEENIAIRCRQEDRSLLTELIPYCREAYQEYMVEHVGIHFQVQLSLAANSTLESRLLSPYKPLQKFQEDKRCIGGVILADVTGDITFKATFDSRLSILKDICLPDMRIALWGSSQTK